MKKCKSIIFLFALSQFSLVYAIDIPSARTITGIPTAVDPGLIQQRLSQTPQPKKVSSAPIQTPQNQEAKPTTAEEKIHFKLNKVVIKGNTVFSTEELENIFAPSLHRMISVADLQGLVNQITVKYRSAGYVLSRAFLPAQVIKNGVVQVQVVEGFISQVEVKGNAGWVNQIIQRYANPALQCRPLQIKTLEKSMLLMNDLPGTQVKAVITPSKTIPAAADLTLVGEQAKVSGYVSYDNYGTRYLGPQETGVGFTLNSVTMPGSSDSLRFMTVAQTSEMEFIEFNHTNPIGENGGKLTLDGNYTNTVPQFVLAPFDIVGRSQVLYADYSYPWIRSRSQNFATHVTANYENVSSTILSGPFYNDLTRSLTGGFDWNGADKLQGINDLRVDIEKAFKILGAEQHLFQSRPLAVPNFFKTNVTLSRLQGLPWNFSLLLATQGQYAFEPLYASQQYAYGGPNWGRGYDPSEIVGDDGWAAKIELRKDQVLDKFLLNVVQYYAFYDAGIIWNRDGINLFPKQSATSIGGGARITFMKNLSGNLFYAKPLTHSIATQVLMGKDPLKPRVFFQLVGSF